jgi:beta-glucosidase
MSGFPRRRAGAAALIAFALIALAATGSSPASPRARIVSGGPWQNPSQPPLLRANELLAAMSSGQKIDLVLGQFAPLQSLGIPALSSDDGPDGVRNAGTTAMPSGQALAASFDRALALAYGQVVGSEARGEGFNEWLGPAGSTRPRVRTPSWPATPRRR